ncbi:MAG TPA: hypothetical protein VMG60_07800 [Burkholderiaceae bacterium]|nr:hypothetical protein [Burkholderiaceae bacterium]
MHEFFYSRDVVDAADRATEPGSTLFAVGLWIRLGFIGASALVAALVSMLDASTRTGVSFAAAAAGAMLVLVAWRRVRKALQEEDRVARATTSH